MVATGGRGWWRRRCQGLGGHLEKRRAKNHVFHTKEHIYNLQISIIKLISLSEIQLLLMSVTFCVERNFSLSQNCAQRTCLDKQDVEKCYFTNPNGQDVNVWVMNLQSTFEDDPTVKEFGITILLEQVWIKLEISQFQHRSIKLHIT